MQIVEAAQQQVVNVYGNRLRTRVCGLCRDGDRLLMVRHRGIGETDTFWCPPGGGAQFGETIIDALKREFVEETGLTIDVGKLLFVNEFLAEPLHALELFFVVEAISGELRLGSDPEMDADGQIIAEVRWMTFDELKVYPPAEVHSLFSRCHSLDDVYRLSGYLI